jgi:hypothetical protein
MACGKNFSARKEKLPTKNVNELSSALYPYILHIVIGIEIRPKNY